jgi:sugar O-acyltransferase (sialic acid O-acetyltransferase NeuD family)
MAREVAWLVESSGQSPVCFIDDNPEQQGRELNGLPVVSLQDALARFPGAEMVVAVGSPRQRREIATRAAAAGVRFATLVDASVRRSRWVSVGEGTVICAGSMLTTNITIGRHVLLNLNCTVAHDVVLGDFATLAPGVQVAGNVHIRAGAFIGVGATIKNGLPGDPLVIGEDAVVGAGACVVRSVPPGVTVLGVPARER